jgi:hypothetical protein
MWPGGPAAITFDFPIFKIYDTPEKALDWLDAALKTAVEVAEDYASDVCNLVTENINAAHNLLVELGSDAATAVYGLFDQLSDLLHSLLSDPLVLDLDGDGIELTALDSSTTLFDLDGDGFVERVGWVGAHDGLLFHDVNGNDIVDGVAELFGSANVDGLDELKGLDSNADGRIDGSDVFVLRTEGLARPQRGREVVSRRDYDSFSSRDHELQSRLFGAPNRHRRQRGSSNC